LPVFAGRKLSKEESPERVVKRIREEFPKNLNQGRKERIFGLAKDPHYALSQNGRSTPFSRCGEIFLAGR
jgi:hypothetical protein